MYRNYKGPFRASGQALSRSLRPVPCWGARPWAVPPPELAAPMDARACCRGCGAGVDAQALEVGDGVVAFVRIDKVGAIQI